MSAEASANAGLLPAQSTREEAIAQYESVAARLLFAGESEPFTLAVTSAVSGEGVSTVCLGLAIALSTSTTRNVVLVDANLRRPSLHDMLGQPIGPGFSDTVAGNEHFQWDPGSTEVFGSLSLSAHATSVPNLWLVPAGEQLDHPAQLTTSDGAKAAIRGLRSRFGFILIDCPPVLTTVDAATLARVADGVLLVVRAGLTPREDVLRARALLEGAHVTGVVLNGV